jgi:hypothetical protein
MNNGEFMKRDDFSVFLYLSLIDWSDFRHELIGLDIIIVNNNYLWSFPKKQSRTRQIGC